MKLWERNKIFFYRTEEWKGQQLCAVWFIVSKTNKVRDKCMWHVWYHSPPTLYKSCSALTDSCWRDINHAVFLFALRVSTEKSNWAMAFMLLSSTIVKQPQDGWVEEAVWGQRCNMQLCCIQRKYTAVKTGRTALSAGHLTTLN